MKRVFLSSVLAITAFTLPAFAHDCADTTFSDTFSETSEGTLSPYVISISGDDVHDNGRASAYTSHCFRINTDDLPGNAAIDNPEWTLELPLADGEIQSLKLADEHLSCTTAPIENEEIYEINSKGAIKARLKFRCTIDGAEYNTSFNIYFELRPFIEYAVIDRIEDNAPLDSYNAYYTVKYLGTDRIKVSVEEEYSSMVVSKYINDPFIASGVAEQITAPFYAWIDFTAENKYGKYVYTIELLPYGVVSDNSGPADDFAGVRSVGIDEPTDCRYEVYDISGIYLGQFAELSDIRNIPAKGILIVRRISKNNIETFKFLNK